MTELSKIMLEKYQIRRTFQQKTDFIRLLKQYFPDLSVQEYSFLKCRNLIVGDISSADVILTAHYDTRGVSLLPNFLAPKNPILSYAYALLSKAPVIAAIVVLNLLLSRITAAAWVHWLLSVALYFLLTLISFLGPDNKHTANDNTSGVIVLCELLGVLSEATRKKVAFVFFDHEEIGLVGSTLFRRKYKKILKNKLLINFDCVSDGEHIMISANKAARETQGRRLKEAFRPSEEISILFTNAEKTLYPSDQKGFPISVAVSVLKRHWFAGFYLDRIHTKKDTVFKRENILHICNCMLRFLKLT